MIIIHEINTTCQTCSQKSIKEDRGSYNTQLRPLGWWIFFAALYVSRTTGLTRCYKAFVFFYRAAWNADEVYWSSDENSVRPSVSLSNAWIVTKRKKNQPRFFIPYERPFNLTFWEEEWLVGATPSTWNFNWENRPSLEQNRRFGTYMYHRSYSASAVTPSEKKYN